MRVGLFAMVLAGIFASSLAGCSPTPPTALILSVDTDYLVPAGLDEITIAVTGPDGMHHDEQQALTATLSRPLTLTLVPANGSLGPVRIVVQGRLAGSVRVTRTAEVTLVAQQTVQLAMFLFQSCDGNTCMGDAQRTCSESGACVSVEMSTVPWTGTPIRIGQDAAVPVDGGMDAGPHDAGSPIDMGPQPDMGPLPDMGPPIDAFIDNDASLDCRMSGCDDGQSCTDDVCGTDGICTHTNTTVSCDDHVFCNGMDTCGGGTCSVHAGNPCLTGTCDEPAGHCVGCTSDSDCPAQMTGAWGACGNFADTCTTAGTQMRTVRSFHCGSNVCSPSDSSETQACARPPTDGSVCGSTSCTTYGACGGFADTCATTGSQSRTCTDLTCSGGACMPHMRGESQSCGRLTDGTSCAATSCTTYGACGGFADTCATSGTHGRTCTDHACSGGTCGSATRTDTASCSRLTDGISCGGTSCGAWTGGCRYPAFGCTTTDVESRTCTDHTCMGGSCAAPTRSETQACPPAPSGTDCNDGTQCGVFQCNGSGSCAYVSGACIGTQICCATSDPVRCTSQHICDITASR